MTIVSRFTPSAYLLGGGAVYSVAKPHFDGVSTYMDLSIACFIRTGDTVSFWMQIPNGVVTSDSYIISHNTWSNALTFFLLEDDGSSEPNEIDSGRCDVLIDGASMSAFPTDGEPHYVTLTGTSFGIFSRIGASPVLDRFSEVTIWGLEVVGADQGDFSAEMTEDFSSYPTLTGTNGLELTAYNFTEDDVYGD